jgi:hypothetical protein
VPVSLTCHADTPSRLESVEVAIEISAEGHLWLRYDVQGPLCEIAVPDPELPDRATGLWATTCFELFARRSQSGGYAEFNFSPSSQWAAYSFVGYRCGMADLELAEPPQIGLDASEDHLALEAMVLLSPEWRGDELQIGLSAIIEEADGAKSYWALQHPPGAPDFHHPDCFALELPAAKGA